MEWKADWTSVKLGTEPDEVIAERLGIPKWIVRYRREKLGVPGWDRTWMGAYPDNKYFWPHVRKQEDGCWVWVRAKPGKYGRARSMAAHRYSWTIHRGPIPAGLFVCHHCDNPPCVNPAHLFLGTANDNVQDAKSKGRTVRGVRQTHAKMTDASVVTAFAMSASGIPLPIIADCLHVSITTVFQALRRMRWQHVHISPILIEAERCAREARRNRRRPCEWCPVIDH